MALKIVEADIRGQLARFAAAAVLSAAVLAAPMVAQSTEAASSHRQGVLGDETALLRLKLGAREESSWRMVR